MNAVEVIPPENPITLIIPADANLEPETALSLKTAFADAFDQAEQWRLKAHAIQVTDITQKKEMAEAREARLALKRIRTDAEKTRKRLKEDSLRKGKAIDGIYNVLAYLVEPLENHLLEQEQFADRVAAKARDDLRLSREQELTPFGMDTSAFNLADMTEAAFNDLWSNASMAHEAKQAAIRKAQEDRIAREKAVAEEQERIRVENVRLRKEAEEREAAAKIEREKAEAARKALEVKAAAEHAEWEAKRKAEQEAAFAAAEVSRKRVEAERIAADEKARKERAAIEAKAKKEKAVLEAKAKAESEAREKVEAELKARKEAEEAAARAKAEEAARAAALPDKERLAAFGEFLGDIALPVLATEKYQRFLEEIRLGIMALVAKIEKEVKS